MEHNKQYDRTNDETNNGRSKNESTEKSQSLDSEGKEVNVDENHQTVEINNSDKLDHHERNEENWSNEESSTRSSESGSIENDQENKTIFPKSKCHFDFLTFITLGPYLPLTMYRSMQARIIDQNGEVYQKIRWTAMKESIEGLISELNERNIVSTAKKIMKNNIFRGRGLLTRSIIHTQAIFPELTPVYGTFMAIMNSKVHYIGSLLVRRLIDKSKKAIGLDNKRDGLSSAIFIAHLVNQPVAHCFLAVQLLCAFINAQTETSFEISIALLEECGLMLTREFPNQIDLIFRQLQGISWAEHGQENMKRMTRILFEMRRNGFKLHQTFPDAQDFMRGSPRHLLDFDKSTDTEDILDDFVYDECYVENEIHSANLLNGTSDSDFSYSSGQSSSINENEDEDESEVEAAVEIPGNRLIELRRRIYVTIYERTEIRECINALMEIPLLPGEEKEISNAIIGVCDQASSYGRFFAVLAGYLCNANSVYAELFEQSFREAYASMNNFGTDKITNLSNFFAIMLSVNSISWSILSCAFQFINPSLRDDEIPERYFIGMLFKELCMYLGITTVVEKLSNIFIEETFGGIIVPNDRMNANDAMSPLCPDTLERLVVYLCGPMRNR